MPRAATRDLRAIAGEPPRHPRASPARTRLASSAFNAANLTFLLLFAFTTFYPFWSTLLLSFSDPERATSLGVRLWISEWTVTAYEFALSRYASVRMAYVNSIFRTVVGTLLGLTVTFLGAYPLSKRDLPGRSGMTVYLLITMYFSGGFVPSYLLVRSLGLLDSRWVLVLPGLASAYYIIVTRNFLMTLDRSYEEAALVDGGSYLHVLFRVVLPLSRAVLATVALWTSVGHWNAWFDALIYINSESKVVLQLLLRRMLQEMTILGEQTNRFELIEHKELPQAAVKAAVTMLTIGPIVLMYPFLQRHFVKGILVGSLKG